MFQINENTISDDKWKVKGRSCFAVYKIHAVLFKDLFILNLNHASMFTGKYVSQ